MEIICKELYIKKKINGDIKDFSICRMTEKYVNIDAGKIVNNIIKCRDLKIHVPTEIMLYIINNFIINVSILTIQSDYKIQREKEQTFYNLCKCIFNMHRINKYFHNLLSDTYIWEKIAKVCILFDTYRQPLYCIKNLSHANDINTIMRHNVIRTFLCIKYGKDLFINTITNYLFLRKINNCFKRWRVVTYQINERENIDIDLLMIRKKKILTWITLIL